MTDLFPVNDPPPEPPSAPDPGDCCGGGCVHCVYDLHDTALDRHQAAHEAWLLRNPQNTPTDDACEP